jgi:hypothetical protein
VGAILDIGCGANKHDGALGVDCRKVPGVAVICDFEQGLPATLLSKTLSAIFVERLHRNGSHA